MLTSLIHLQSTNETAADDIFTSSLGLLFTDDIRNAHGNPGEVIIYRSRKYGDLEFRTADPNKEEERTKFAHYLWNAGVLIGELVGGHPDDLGPGVSHDWERIEGPDCWWISRENEQLWSVKGEKVLELGAGVGLASIVSVKSGAEEVAITDYPSATLLKTLKQNVEKNLSSDAITRVSIEGHQWGDCSTPFATSHAGYFTRILAADCLWMPQEHTNLARSMLHFLSSEKHARILIVSGFHTGRIKLAPFFEETVGKVGLEIEELWEMDANGQRRPWQRGEKETEDIGERKKWLVLARLCRKQ
ncbi:hypothetical protein M501DRAFT_944105 [Patellaria atrata CBS 101060]|uniref:Nicotinamide N-methyltransferase n=1 Tax=Patellaria atrata CBS 101060 TaxID=1346257 RepID=A0A9P4S1H7_9PEZI|nr:hypothetical protein M501DRAFT_944105 [Patellaria atrata CBS 101060]